MPYADITLTDCVVSEDNRLQNANSFRDTRATVALAREVFGGNGILLGSSVARYFADAEAIYFYEGTREINQLIVGRAVTGKAAFA